jgi:ERCC4-type nuclease
MITIDDREAITHFTVHNELMRAFGHENTIIERMDWGDYAFTGAPLPSNPKPRIGIELSSISDVVGKINSGRLAFQLSGMIDAYDIPVLLVESPPSATKDGWIYIPGAPRVIRFDRFMDVLSAAQMHGVRVLYCADKSRVGARILSLYHYWQKPYTEHKTFRHAQLEYELRIPIGEAVDSRVSLLMQVPGVGEDRAVAALKTYGSLRTLFIMPTSMLVKIPGWGLGTATALRKMLDTTVYEGTLMEKAEILEPENPIQ